MTKIAGPVNGTGSSGVWTVACPMNDAEGHPAGFASNCLSVHAFCRVVRREGSCNGNSTLTFAMFAWLPCGSFGSVTFVTRSAPSALLVLPLVETENLGVNFRLAQFVTWNGTPILSVFPSLEWIVPVTSILLQLVGLNWKLSRVVIALMCWISSGMPSIDVGIAYGVPGGLEVTVSAAVRGLTSILPRTITQSQESSPAGFAELRSRSYGPAFAGTSNVMPNGAP